MMDPAVLEDLGFTPAEAKVYLALLRLGPSRVGDVIEKTGLQSSTVHNTLNTLAEKGFVTHILRGKIREYRATDPRLLLKERQDRVERLRSSMPELEAMGRWSAEPVEAEVYEGMNGIFRLLDDLIEDAEPGDALYFFAVDVEGRNEAIQQQVFERTDVRRRAKGIEEFGVAPSRLRPLFAHRKYKRMRYFDFPIPSNITICNDKMALFSWDERPVGVLIRSRHLVERQVRFFKELQRRGRA